MKLLPRCVSYQVFFSSLLDYREKYLYIRIESLFEGGKLVYVTSYVSFLFPPRLSLFSLSRKYVGLNCSLVECVDFSSY